MSGRAVVPTTNEKSQHHRGGGLAIKVALRHASLPDADPCVVLDCYAGDGDIWRGVRALNRDRRIVVVGSDSDPKRAARRGVRKADASQLLRAVDLDRVHVIDLDAWGQPARELTIVHERGFQGVVHVTWIAVAAAGAPHAALEALGIPRGWSRVAPVNVRECSPEWAANVIASIGFQHQEGVGFYDKPRNAFSYRVLQGHVDEQRYKDALASFGYSKGDSGEGDADQVGRVDLERDDGMQ